jgi:hypothetical protein
MKTMSLVPKPCSGMTFFKHHYIISCSLVRAAVGLPQRESEREICDCEVANEGV